jgi:Glycogen recognition site of AMP-activated protein kinase
MRRPHSNLPTLVLCALLLPGGLRGQAGDIRLEVGASRSFPPAGVDATTSNYLTGALRADWMSGSTGLFGGVFGGISTDNLGGDFLAATAGGRLTTGRGPLSASVLGVGTGFRVGAPFVYETFTGLLQPEIRIRSGRTVLALIGEGGLGRTRIEFRRDRLTRTATADLWHYGGGAEIRIEGPRVLLTVGGAAYEATAGRYSKGEVQLVLALPSGGQIRGEVGIWSLPVGTETTGEISVTVPVGRWFAEASGGRSAPDPLLRTEPGRQGWLTVGRVLKRFGPAPRVPLLTLEPSDAGAVARFRIDGGAAEKVELIGDFTDWEPVELSEGRGSVWTVTMALPPGTHHFGFLLDGTWFVPDSAPGRVADDWGQVNATVVVQ